MRTVNMHEAKTQLSRLVKRAAEGEAFIIARAGKPLVKVIPFEESAPAERQRLGFLRGRGFAPVDIKAVGSGEIAELFEGRE